MYNKWKQCILAILSLFLQVSIFSFTLMSDLSSSSSSRRSLCSVRDVPGDSLLFGAWGKTKHFWRITRMNKTSLEEEQNKIWILHYSVNVNFPSPSTEIFGMQRGWTKKTYHGLFDILLIIIATCSIVITVNDLNSDVTLGKTSAPFTCEDWK